MDRKMVEIEPLEIVTVKHKHSFNVYIIDVRIFESVMLSVDFFDENRECVERTRLHLSGEDYTNWGTDDNYLVNYVATKYGLTVKAPAAQATEPAAEATEPAAEAVE
jgi:hypothetical protein